MSPACIFFSEFNSCACAEKKQDNDKLSAMNFKRYFIYNYFWTKIRKVLKKKIYIAILILILSSLGWFIYKCLSKEYDPFDVDISGIELEINMENLTDSFRVQNSLDYDDSIKLYRFRKKYNTEKNEILDFWLSACLGIDYSNDSMYLKRLSEFYQDSYNIEIDSLISKKIILSTAWKTEITDAFKRLKIHCPNYESPQDIYTVNSLYGYNALSFNQPIELPTGILFINNKKSIVIQQEKYIGMNSLLYNDDLLKSRIFPWMIEKYNESFLKRDIIEKWLESVVFKEEADNDIIHEIIRRGKIHYFIHASMPNENISNILRYYPSEMNWLNSKEKFIWRFLIENEIIFKSDDKTKHGLFSPGPFSPIIQEKDPNSKSPDRIGNYIGYQMILNFMKENASKDYTLVNLLSEKAENIYKIYNP